LKPKTLSYSYAQLVLNHLKTYKMGRTVPEGFELLSQRRKTLLNILSAFYPMFGARHPSHRAESLTTNSIGKALILLAPIDDNKASPP